MISGLTLAELDSGELQYLLEYGREQLHQRISDFCSGDIPRIVNIESGTRVFLDSWIAAGRPNFDRRDLLNYFRSENFWKFVNSPTIKSVVEERLPKSERDQYLLCPTVNFRFKSSMFPWAGIPKHYDAWYWEQSEPEKKFDFCVLWIPLTPVDTTSGMLRFDVEAPKLMKPGSFLVFDPYTMHWSERPKIADLALTLDFRVEVRSKASEETIRFDCSMFDETSTEIKFFQRIDAMRATKSSSNNSPSGI